MEENMGIKKLQQLQYFIWPIRKEEHKKFIPMMVIVGCMIFNYSILRSIKDTLVVVNGGPEMISFLKVWVVMPFALIFLFVYTKLSNFFSRNTLFYGSICFFLIFFLVFTFLLYPNRNILHPIDSGNALITMVPPGLKGLVSIYKLWSFSLFYAMAELWGSVVLSFLFWNFANSLTVISEAKRFYAHFYLLGNVASIGAGTMVSYFSKSAQRWIPIIADEWQACMTILLTISVFLCFVIMFSYYYLNNHVLSDSILIKELSGAPKKESKVKLSMLDSFKSVLSSKYLLLMTILVVAYGISINLVEISWKNQVFLYFADDKVSYTNLMGAMSRWTGYGTILAIVFGSTVMRKFGWQTAALITPIVIGFTSIIFFICILFPVEFNRFISSFGLTASMTAIGVAVWVGLIQNVLSKSIKYALFDPTKEMAYIPLDQESRSKGKAAVDIIGARLGKSGASLLLQIMYTFIGPISVIGPYCAVITILVVITWIFAVHALSKRFSAIST